MPLRILLIILAFLLFTNLLFLIVSFLLNTNIYKTHGKLILNFYGICALFIVILYFLLPILNR